MAAKRAVYLYTASADGVAYRVLIPVWLGSYAANLFGFGADDVTKAPLPRYIKKRYVTAKDPVSGRHRKVHCGNITCAGWTSVSLGVTLPNIDDTATVYTTDGQVGEKRRGFGA